MRYRSLVFLAGAIIGATIFLQPVSSVQAADLETCDSVSDPKVDCTSTELILQDNGHVCAWQGLTLSCTDYYITKCTYQGNKECVITSGEGYTKIVKGVFQVADAVTQFVRLSQWGLGFVVVLAVLMFVWAGFQFLTAAGRADKVEAGKRIIGGTITGLIISFSAYVLVNFTVLALTGTMGKTKDVLNPVALLFPGEKGLERPFGGSTEDMETRTSCRSSNNETWDKGCSDHMYCADTGEGTNGEVAKIQKALKDKKCLTGSIDGCYGKQTVDATRAFQIANLLAPSGVFDADTSAAMFAPGPMFAKECDSTSAAVMSNLPKAIEPDASWNFKTDPGCCIVSDGTDGLYCLANVTVLTCETLNARGGNEFLQGKSCNGADTNNRCGSCQSQKFAVTPPDSYNCFEYATPAWCSQYGRDASDAEPLKFTPSTCKYRCQNGTCRTTLLLNPK